MFRLRVNKARITILEKETITSGRLGLKIKLEFSPEWEDLNKVIVFEAGSLARKAQLAADNTITIPNSVLEFYGKRLKIGIKGYNDSDIIIPTIYADLGEILRGTSEAGALPAEDPIISDPIQADWNENNPEALDYIKGRICYIDENGNIHRLNDQYLPQWLSQKQINLYNYDNDNEDDHGYGSIINFGDLQNDDADEPGKGKVYIEEIEDDLLTIRAAQINLKCGNFTVNNQPVAIKWEQF